MTDRDARERDIYAAISRPAGAVTLHDHTLPQRVVELWLRRFRSSQTRRTYASHLAAFASWARVEPDEAAARLFAETDVNAVVDMWAATRREAGLSVATVSLGLSAIASLLTYGRERRPAATTNRLEVRREKSLPYRDTAGPSPLEIRALFAAVEEGSAPIRDRALLSMLFPLGLRVAEVAALNHADIETNQSRLWVDGKGRGHEREAVALDPATCRALARHMETQDAGPLFRSLRGPTQGDRITDNGVRDWLVRLCRRAGVRRLHPHSLRHAMVTIALDSGAAMRDVSAAARHVSGAVTERYDDNRRAAGGGVARRLAEITGLSRID